MNFDKLQFDFEPLQNFQYVLYVTTKEDWAAKKRSILHSPCPIELVHLNISGKVEKKTLHGENFTATFFDNYTVILWLKTAFRINIK